MCVHSNGKAVSVRILMKQNVKETQFQHKLFSFLTKLNVCDVREYILYGCRAHLLGSFPLVWWLAIVDIFNVYAYDQAISNLGKATNEA